MKFKWWLMGEIRIQSRAKFNSIPFSKIDIKSTDGWKQFLLQPNDRTVPSKCIKNIFISIWKYSDGENSVSNAKKIVYFCDRESDFGSDCGVASEKSSLFIYYLSSLIQHWLRSPVREEISTKEVGRYTSHHKVLSN